MTEFNWLAVISCFVVNYPTIVDKKENRLKFKAESGEPVKEKA